MRFPSERDASMFAKQLREKYDRADVRAVVAVSDGALAFLRKQQLFEDVPTVAYTEGRPPVDAASTEPHVVRSLGRAHRRGHDRAGVAATRIHPATICSQR